MSETTDALESMGGDTFELEPKPEPKPALPAFWVTHLAKALVGEQPCLLSPWLSGRQKFPARGDGATLALWKTQHTALLHDTVRRYQADGWTCDVERYFRVTGERAIISGKADLILRHRDMRPVVLDAKSGLPRESDLAQVMIEMILMPLAWTSPGLIFSGLVVYLDHKVPVTPAQAEALRPKLFALVRRLATTDRQPAAPSESACKFCNVPASECSERWTEDQGSAAVTKEF